MLCETKFIIILASSMTAQRLIKDYGGGGQVIELLESISGTEGGPGQGASSSLWLLVKESFAPIVERGGDMKVDQTEVSIALSLDEADAGMVPTFRDTFAYLPCCRSNLRQDGCIDDRVGGAHVLSEFFLERICAQTVPNKPGC
jgi:hypothetical protein